MNTGKWHLMAAIVLLVSQTGRAVSQSRTRDTARTVTLSSVHFILARDRSLSLQPYTAEIRRQAPSLGAVVQKVGDRLSLVEHGRTVRTVLDRELPTAESLVAAVKTLRSAEVQPVDAWTSLNALLARVQSLSRLAKGRPIALAWLTDAVPSQPTSRATQADWQGALARARRLRPQLRAVLIGVPSSDAAKQRLPQLARALGAKLITLDARGAAAAEVSRALAEVRMVVQEQRLTSHTSSKQRLSARTDRAAPVLWWVGLAALALAGPLVCVAWKWRLLHSLPDNEPIAAVPAVPFRRAEIAVFRVGGSARGPLIPRPIGAPFAVDIPYSGSRPVPLGGPGSPVPMPTRLLSLTVGPSHLDVTPAEGVTVTNNGQPADRVAWPAVLDVGSALRIYVREPGPTRNR